MALVVVSDAAAKRAALAEVSVVVVNYNSGPWLKRCVRALRRAAEDVPTIVVVDNASSDGSADEVADLPQLQLLRQAQNLGFARGVNLGVAATHTPYVLIHNPDCLIVPDNLLRLLAVLARQPAAAMVSGRVFDMCGSEQRGSRRRLPTPQRALAEWWGRPGGLDLSQQAPPAQAEAVEAVSGACMLVRRSAFDAVGGMDEGYPMHFEDLDLMWRLQQAGYQIWLEPQVAISHAGGVSSDHRPWQVLRDKHIGLWRYLQRHCGPQWPRWSRPLWAIGLGLNLAVAAVRAWRHRRA